MLLIPCFSFSNLKWGKIKNIKLIPKKWVQSYRYQTEYVLKTNKKFHVLRIAKEQEKWVLFFQNKDFYKKYIFLSEKRDNDFIYYKLVEAIDKKKIIHTLLLNLKRKRIAFYVLQKNYMFLPFKQRNKFNFIELKKLIYKTIRILGPYATPKRCGNCKTSFRVYDLKTKESWNMVYYPKILRGKGYQVRGYFTLGQGSCGDSICLYFKIIKILKKLN